jgi:uncharacterized glyoxalase superfamily protein PhnB
MTSQGTPDGWHTVTPRFFVDDPAAFIDFLKHTFRATGDIRPDGPSNISIGDSIVMISESGPRDSMPACLYVYVDDADAAYRRALERGASSVEEPQDLFYGDRRAMVKDRWGNVWQIATPI